MTPAKLFLTLLVLSFLVSVFVPKERNDDFNKSAYAVLALISSILSILEVIIAIWGIWHYIKI